MCCRCYSRWRFAGLPLDLLPPLDLLLLLALRLALPLVLLLVLLLAPRRLRGSPLAPVLRIPCIQGSRWL